MAAKKTRKNAANAGGLEGRYANYFKVGHNAFEFVLDFGQLYGRGVDARFHSRIITNPIYAKTFMQLLQESIEQYETMFGEINEDK